MFAIFYVTGFSLSGFGLILLYFFICFINLKNIFSFSLHHAIHIFNEKISVNNEAFILSEFVTNIVFSNPVFCLLFFYEIAHVFLITKIIETCNLPKESGDCSEKQAKWYFSQSDNKCMPFYYSGCGGNENSFDSENSCAEQCPSVIGEENFVILFPPSTSHIHYFLFVFLSLFLYYCKSLNYKVRLKNQY
jgi:hypothetical protein